MIEHISIKNFKSIREVDLDLKPINILIGPNGAGKSNFVNFFGFVHAIYDGQMEVYTAERGGAGRILYLGSKVSELLKGEVLLSDGTKYQFDLGITDIDGFYYRKKAMMYEKYFRPFFVFHLSDTSRASPLKQSARVNDIRFLRPDGSNLPAFLYALKRDNLRNYNLIEAIVRQIAPFFDRFDLQPNGDFIRLNWRQKGTDMYLDASDLSDGTIRFIGLATLLLQPNPPETILIDEPELGLHPYAINTLAGLMRSISIRTQLIVSTQSLELVNQFEPEDIIVVEHKNNESTLKRLNSNELNEWLTDYSIGDLWQKNVIGGNP